MPLVEFLILGCQRSGTTMVAAALSRHPDVAVYDERLAYRALTGDAEVPDLASPAVGFKIPRWTDLLPGPIRGESDQRLQGEWTYAGQPSVFVVRDPWAVVASMQRLVIRERPWLVRYGVPLARARLAQNQSLRERFGWVEELSPVARKWALGAVYWVAKNESLDRYLAAGYRIFPVQYERLVDDPTTWRSMLGFLDLNWDPAVTGEGAGSLVGTDAENRGAGGTDPTRAVDARSVERRQEVPEDIRGLIGAIVGDLPSRLAELCAPGQAQPSGRA